MNHVNDREPVLKDYEFTKIAYQGIQKTIDAEDFENRDAEIIEKYLLSEIKLVSFSDHLKRYVHRTQHMQGAISDIDDVMYSHVISRLFKQNHAPFAMTPTSRRPSQIIRSWLTQKSVSREAVFVLGFGLAMSVKDVEKFLKAAIQEQGFDLYNPEEAVYWYCYKNHLQYDTAQELLSYYSMQDRKSMLLRTRLQIMDLNDMKDEEVTEQDMAGYLRYLHSMQKSNHREAVAWRRFEALMLQARKLIADIYNADEKERRRAKVWTMESIGPSDVEQMLCSGIPVDANGNLRKAAESIFADQFAAKRMSRQRIDEILKHKRRVDRFDLITMQFFISSQELKDEPREKRYMDYIRTTNAILEECAMGKLYPVNSYETFILLCILSDVPLTSYSDVWELSYSG